MPSALETMVKILKLEREHGGKNTAVVGGLAAFAGNWEAQAREQARRPQHHILIDEITESLREYDMIEDEDERIARLNHLLNRATNREPPPPEYRKRLAEWERKMPSDQQRRGSPRAPHSAPAHSDRRGARQSHASRRRGFQPYDSASWDEDFTGGPQDRQLDLSPLPTLSRPPRGARPELNLETQRALHEELEAPTTAVKGVGKKFAELLGALDIHNVRDMLYRFPRDYRDYTAQTCIRDLQPGARASVIGTVKRVKSVFGQRGRDLVLLVSDGSGSMSVRFFGQHFLEARMRPGMQLVLRGKVGFFRDMAQMASPEWEELDPASLHTRGIVPVYAMTQGLRPRHYRRTIRSLVDEWAEKIPDPLPGAVLDRAELADLGWALSQAHFPEGWDHLRHAQRRLSFDGLLMLQLAMLSKRRAWQSAPGPQLQVDQAFINAFIDSVFPFTLTEAQRKAIDDISQDIARPVPMNRLLQGDVGSGKTAVAIVCLALARNSGMQATLMAPTSILAEQHYRVVCETFDRMPGDEKPVIALLTSALSKGERESIYRGAADGSIDIVVGTHSIIQEGLAFNQLGIAVIDEQQRFGVDQRAALRGKGHNPHLLVMTATPIPRTLALTLHADLDLSVIDEKPAGRQAIITKIIDPVARERMHGFVVNQLESGRQAFFVHPLVEESETVETPAATEAYERLSQVFFRFRVCLLHGRMSASEKDELMADFAARKYDVMVTTAVAEVGVDVPNATMMIIDGANRFGLAQLHQFRGRVGRGEYQSYCFLLPDSASQVSIDRIRSAQSGELSLDALSIAEQRLAAMETTTDGFALAELDWRLRGAGDLLGTRQSGENQLQMLAAISPELVAEAQREARTLFEEDPALKRQEHRLLRDRIIRLHADGADLS